MASLPRSHLDRLVDAGLRGDRAAFEALYDIWFAAVWTAASREAGAAAAAATVETLRKAFADRLLARGLPEPSAAAPPAACAAREA
jgi:hypothetical protein